MASRLEPRHAGSVGIEPGHGGAVEALRGTLVWERLGDTPDTERGACGLLDAANVPKPAAKKLLAIRNRLQKPLLAPKPDARKASEVEANDETAAGSPPA